MPQPDAYSQQATSWTPSPQRLDLVELGNALAAIAIIFLGLTVNYRGMFEIDAADDIFFKFTHDGTYSLALASYVNGRFIPGLLFQGLASVGIQIFDIWHVLQITAFIALSALSYTFVRCLNLRLPPIESLVTATIIAFIPYNTILLVNKNNALNAAIAFTAMCLAIWSFSRLNGKIRIVVTSISLFIVVSCYQTTIYYFAVFLFSYHLFNGTEKKEVYTGILLGILTCVAAIAAYLVIFKLTRGWALEQIALNGNSEVAQYYGTPRSGLNDFSTLPVSAILYIISIGRILATPEPIFPLSVKVFGAAVFFAGYYFWCRPGSNSDTAMANGFIREKRHLMLLALVIAVASPIHLIIANNWLAPRIYAHVGGIWAVLFLTALVYGPQRWRRVTLACCAIFSLALAYYTSWITTKIETRFERDTILARAIVADIRRMPDFEPSKPVAFVGKVLEGPRNDDHSFKYYITMTASKFDKRWAMLGTLEEATGERFRRPGKALLTDAKRICLERPPGTPSYDVRASAKGLVVCLRSSWLLPEADS